MAADYVIRLDHDPATIGELQEEWSALLQECAASNLFLTPEWSAVYWEHFGRSGNLWLVTVRNATGRLVGLAVLTVRWHHPLPVQKLGLLRWRQLEFVGRFAAADHLDFLAVRGQETQVINAILDEVWRHRFHWDVLAFDGIPAESGSAAILRQRGWAWKELPGRVCPRITLPQDWESYFMALSRLKRKEQRRFVRQLDEAFPGRWEAAQVADPSCIAETLDAMIAFHQAKWNSAGKPGAFADPTVADFHHALAQDLHRRGQLRLFRLEIDGQLVAALYTLRYGDQVFDYISGFNFDYADYSPGQVLTEASLREAIATGVKRYEFMRGDEQYKFRWLAEETRDLSLRWIASPHARAVYLLHSGLRSAWQVGKRALPLGWRHHARSRFSSATGIDG